MAIAPITYQPVAPTRPVRRRRPDAEEQREEARSAEVSGGTAPPPPRFDPADTGEDPADADFRRRSRGLALVAAQVTFQAQQYAQEQLGAGLYYEPWRAATAAYRRWSPS